MVKGDIVIADNPESSSTRLTRFYGIVLEITKTGSVFIELSDGSVITRQFNSIAVYKQPPSNWQELFEQQEIVYSHPKQTLFTLCSKTKRPRYREERSWEIFEPFFSTKSKGTRLGLAVSYGIIHNHQGVISIQSRPDEGTKFIIRIPVFAGR